MPKCLTDNDIQIGMTVKIKYASLTDIDRSYIKHILSNHMRIVNSHYCPSCSMNHYRAEFINHNNAYLIGSRNYTVNAYMLYKANEILPKAKTVK